MRSETESRAELRFRPHHFLCTLCFRGRGYTADFARAYGRIAARLRDSPDGDSVRIRVVEGPDAVCDVCPRLDGEICETQDKVTLLDAGHARVLGLKAGRVLTWAEAKLLLSDRMTKEAFDAVCAPCGWKPRGICEEVLEELRWELGKHEPGQRRGQRDE